MSPYILYQFKPFSPNSDQIKFLLITSVHYNIGHENKAMITHDELSWCLKKFSQLVLNRTICMETTKESLYNDGGA